MAEEETKEAQGPGQEFNLDGDDNTPFEELGIDLDEINKEVSQISPQKVELDTSGLDLDFEDEPEPAADIQEMDEELPEAGDVLEEEPAKKGRPGWFLPVVGGGGLVFVAALLAVVYFLFLTPKKEAPAPAPVKEEKVAVVQELPVGVPLLAMPDFSIPLQAKDKTLLRISIHLALKSESAKAYLLSQNVKVRNTIYQTLLESAQGELKTVEQRLALREDLMARLNRAFSGNPVQEIYFTQFLIL